MAAADGLRCIRNAPYRVRSVILNGNLDAVTSPTLSAVISKDSATTGATTNSPSAIAGASGMFSLDLTVTEMTFSYTLDLLFEDSGSGSNAFLSLVPEPCLESGVCQSGSTSTTAVLRSTASSTPDLFNGAQIEIVRGTGQGQVRTITDYNSSQTATIDRAWITTPDNTSVYIIHPRIGVSQATVGVPDVNVVSLDTLTEPIDIMKYLYSGAIVGTVSDGGPSTTDFDGSSGFSGTNDFYNDCGVVFIDGDLQGIMRPVNDYTGSSKNFSFSSSEAWPTAPANGDRFLVISFIRS